MVLNPLKKTYIINILLLIILLIKSDITFAGEVYVPEPIIFIHGINSDEGTWNTAKNNLKKYFIDEVTGLPKYDYPNANQKWYYPRCDYKSMNMGDIPIIAQSKLTGSIYTGIEALNNIPDCITKKVNIVGHSMGGLVTRSLLKGSDLQNSIDKVIFIGTPHNGSPYASALWLLNKVEQDVLPDAIRQNALYYSKPVFSSSIFSLPDRLAYYALANNLRNRYNNIHFALSKASEKGLNPQSDAINELRLNENVSYSSTISGSFNNRTKSITITANYSGSDTFLSPTRNNLATPKIYKTIVGVNTSDNRFWGLGKILGFGDAFNFPAGETLDDVSKYGGDGIVSLNSQWSLGHTDAVINGTTHLDETAQATAILNAIDDLPEIESVYAVPCNWNDNSWDYYYIVVKVKEYLLADVEIQSISLNDDPANIDLTGFSATPGTPPYKPYIKFGKNFLTERSDPQIRDKDNKIIPLKPGEFYVKAYFPGRGYGSPPIYTYDLTYKFKIVLKNPANKTKDETIFICRPKADCYWSTYCIDVPPYFEDGGISTSTTISHLDISSGSSSKVSVKVGMCGSGSHTPFLTFPERDVDLHSNGNYFEGNVKDYATWDGSNGSGGTVAQEHDYNVKINIYPHDVYAEPNKGDCKFDIPIFVFPYYGIVRADPTFIQSHRSYGHLAKFNTRKIFEQYGYCLNIRKLNANENISLSVKAEEKSPNVKTLIAYQYLLPDYLSNAYRTQLDSINKAVSQKINEAVIKIVAIENNFDVEKEKLISNAESEFGNNVNILEALMDNKVPQESISRIEEQNEQLKSQLITQALEKLKNIKDIQISTIIKETNALVVALINKETPRAIASSVVFR